MIHHTGITSRGELYDNIVRITERVEGTPPPSLPDPPPGLKIQNYRAGIYLIYTN